MSDSIWKLVGFQNSDKQSSEYLNKDIPGRLLVDSAQCIIGVGKNLESGLLINYDNDEYSQGYEQINEASRALTQDETLERYISDHDFRFSNAGVDDVGYNSFVFDLSYQTNSTVARPIKVEIKFDGVIPAYKKGML